MKENKYMIVESHFDEQHPKFYRAATQKLSDEISVVEIGCNKVPKGLRQILKRDVYILHYIVDGFGSFLSHPFDATCGYLTVPHEPEIMEADAEIPYESYWIMFRGSRAAELLDKCGLPTHNCVFSFASCRAAADILHHAIFEIEPQNEYEEAGLMQAAFFELMALHLRNITNRATCPSVAASVMRYLNENYQQSIRIEALAKQYNFTRNYLYTLFKKEYKMSPQEYLTTLRLEKARQLLSEKNLRLSVNEVAFAVGFNDPLYFSRAFRRAFGVSPREYKKNMN